MRLTLALLAMLLAAPVHAQYQDAVMNDQPSAYWPLTDAVGPINAYESIGNLWTYAQAGAQFDLGAPGRTGGTAWHYGGPFAWTYEYSHRWEVAHAPAIDLADGPMTVEAWHKSDIPTGTWHQVLVEKLAAYAPGAWNHPWAGGGFSLTTQYWHGGYIASVNGNGVYDAVVVYGATDVPANVWTHVAMTFDGSTLRLYVNGVLDGQNTVSATQVGFPHTNGGPLRIGSSTVQEFWCDTGVTSYCGRAIFHGSLQHLALYKHALTAAQVAAHYDAATNGDAEGLSAKRAATEGEPAPAPKPVVPTWGSVKVRYR